MEIRGGGEEPAVFDIRLLGAVEARYEGRVLDLGGTMARSVLAVLLLHAGQMVPTARIVAYAWRGDPPVTAEDLVVAYVSRLRKALAPAGDLIRLRSVRPGFCADLAPGLVDVHRFTALVELAGGDREGREDELAADHLRQALDLWRGGGSALADMESDWLRTQARVLEGRRLDALERLARIELDGDRPDAVAALLREAAPTHPEREGLTVMLVRAMTMLGESARAADLAARACQSLIELGQEPGPELRRAQTAALARRPDRSAVANGSRGPRHQLPGDTSAFTGRERELAEFLNLAVGTGNAGGTRNATSPAAVVICAVDGMAGIGKTALAIHAGHQLAERFPDGQLFLDLHGYTQGLTPREPADALAALLQAFGIAPGQIPADLGARAALYRDRLAGTRTLIVLDNANSEAQVRPLLPGDGGCLVLVTSRRRLKALDDARALSLDVLPVPDAIALFREVAGPGRTPPNDPLLDEIAALCGRLPLALRIAAALLRHRRAWTLARLADKLRQSRPDLAGFFDGDRNLTCIFDLSYAALGDDQRLLFRRLGLAPGPDTDAYAVAALLDRAPADAEDLLQDLVDHNLLAEPAAGRYRMHDLIRAHTRTLAAQDPAESRDAAAERLLDYYQHTARSADTRTFQYARHEPRGSAPAHWPVLRDPDEAHTWLRAERANIEACLALAAGQGRHERVVGLTEGLAELLYADGPWSRARVLHAAAAAAAEHLGDERGQADALHNLGRVLHMTGNYPSAADAHARAAALFHQLSEQSGQADALNELGRVLHTTGDYPGAAEAHARALALYQESDDLAGQANALTERSKILRLTADSAGAAEDLSRALALYEKFGDRLGQAKTLATLGWIRQAAGDEAGAADAHARALTLYRELGEQPLRSDTADDAEHEPRTTHLPSVLRERLDQAGALIGLARMRRMAGDYPGALEAHTRALSIYRDVGSHDNEAWATNLYAAIFAAAGDLAQALVVYREALRLTREVQHRDDEAIALEGIGECLVRTENSDSTDSTGSTGSTGRSTSSTEQGVEYLNQALDAYRRLGMRPDIERVQTRLSALSTR